MESHYPNPLKNSKSNIFPKTLQCKEPISHSLEPRPEKREGEHMNRMSGCHGTAQYTTIHKLPIVYVRVMD